VAMISNIICHLRRSCWQGKRMHVQVQLRGTAWRSNHIVLAEVKLVHSKVTGACMHMRAAAGPIRDEGVTHSSSRSACPPRPGAACWGHRTAMSWGRSPCSHAGQPHRQPSGLGDAPVHLGRDERVGLVWEVDKMEMSCIGCGYWKPTAPGCASDGSRDHVCGMIRADGCWQGVQASADHWSTQATL
jgi:hypothetical protein